jgi:hypothetical protein
MDGNQGAVQQVALAALRGLAVAVVSIGAGVGAGVAIIALAPDEGPCTSDLACLPDLRPMFLAVFVMPVLMAVIGPLTARLLRLRRPALFAIPAALAAAWLCAGLVPAGQGYWGLVGVVGVPVVLLMSYVVIAVWVAKPAVDAGPPLTPPAPGPQRLT